MLAILADINKMVTFFLLKQSLKTQEKLKALEICVKMQSMHAFLDIAKLPVFRRKIVDVSGTQEVCHVIHIFF